MTTKGDDSTLADSADGRKKNCNTTSSLSYLSCFNSCNPGTRDCLVFGFYRDKPHLMYIGCMCFTIFIDFLAIKSWTKKIYYVTLITILMLSYNRRGHSTTASSTTNYALYWIRKIRLPSTKKKINVALGCVRSALLWQRYQPGHPTELNHPRRGRHCRYFSLLSPNLFSCTPLHSPSTGLQFVHWTSYKMKVSVKINRLRH